MWFPHPMNNFKFNNKYNIILCTFSLLLDHFKKEDQLFSEQCIWWLASIIQFTEILTNYRQCKIFPANYLNKVVVTPLPESLFTVSLIPDLNIPELNIATEVNQLSVVKESFTYLGHTYQTHILKKNNTVQSGRISKYQDPSDMELQRRFGKHGTRQRAHTRALLRDEAPIQHWE